MVWLAALPCCAMAGRLCNWVGWSSTGSVSAQCAETRSTGPGNVPLRIPEAVQPFFDTSRTPPSPVYSPQSQNQLTLTYRGVWLAVVCAERQQWCEACRHPCLHFQHKPLLPVPGADIAGLGGDVVVVHLSWMREARGGCSMSKYHVRRLPWRRCLDAWKCSGVQSAMALSG